MGRIGVYIVFLLFLGLALAEAAPKPSKPIKPKHAIKCNDKRSPCYNLNSYCPMHCPTSCQVNCKTCRIVCTSPPPKEPSHPKSPPPKKPSHPPPPPTKSHPPPPLVPVYTPPTANTTHPSGPKKVRCTNKKYPLCYYKEHSCPNSCPGSCEVDCVTCSPVCNCDKPGAVCQDPRFIGADGITFYFHGKKERDFCLVADSNLHINGHFIGKRNDNMSRDFTWVQSLGILFDHHKVYIGAQKTATWNDADDRLALSFDGEPIILPELRGATWNSSNGALTITRTQNANGIEMEVKGKFKIKAVVVPITHKESILHNYGIEKDDNCFAHLDLSFKFHALSSNVSGVLGQTYAPTYVSRVKMGVTMPILGGDELFSSSSLFSADCSVSKFSDDNTAFEESNRFGDLNCATGLSQGLGVVCKR